MPTLAQGYQSCLSYSEENDMKHETYKTSGTCSRQIDFDIDEALAMKKSVDEYMYDISKSLV